jgi:hypothetical protein
MRCHCPRGLHPPNGNVHHPAVIRVRDIVNLVNNGFRQPTLNLFLQILMGASEYLELHQPQFSKNARYRKRESTHDLGVRGKIAAAPRF